MKTLRQRFDDFDTLHPEVYEVFKKYAADLLRRGFRHYSSRTIVSVMRFHSDVNGSDYDGFKINNDWSPYYARKLMREDARFTDFFSLRGVQDEERIAA